MSERLVALKEFLGSSTSGSPARECWVFPSPQKPRFVIPSDPRFWREGLAFVSSGKKRFLLSILLRVFRLLRRRADFIMPGSWPPQFADLFEGKIAHLACYISTPSRFSKYTLVFLDELGAPLAFAKLSEGKDAERAISDEVKALHFLAKAFPNDQTFPRIIHHEAGFAIQSPAPSSGHGQLAENAGRIASRLFRLDSHEVSWEDSQTRRSLIEAKQEIQEAQRSDLSDLLDEMERELAEKFQNTPLREGLTHGDFVSWNMADGPQGFVFDWEWLGRRAEYHDLFHFLCFHDFQGKKAPEAASFFSRWHSPEAKSLLEAYQAEGKGPLCQDALLYLASSFAFYSRHCIANQNDPLAFPFMIAILNLFRTLAKWDPQTPCQAFSSLNK